MTLTLLQLFWTFFLIGLFNFGGGGAMISLIQSKVVTQFGWISQGQFTDIVAISQTTPGPIGINCATYVGFEVGRGLGGTFAGIAGSALATFALVLPSFIIFWGIVRLYNKYRGTALFGNVMTALRPAVAGLIGAAALILMFKLGFGGVSVLTENFPDWTSWAILAVSVAASLIFKVNPILLILAGGLLGFIIY